jgi:hypothetical protein
MAKQKLSTDDVKDQQEKLASATNNKIALPSGIADKYDVKPGTARVFLDCSVGRTIDLNTISEAEAERLAGRGRLIKKQS